MDDRDFNLAPKRKLSRGNLLVNWLIELEIKFTGISDK
jgi:hypothetical protein